jgi:hypothetical protein
VRLVLGLFGADLCFAEGAKELVNAILDCFLQLPPVVQAFRLIKVPNVGTSNAWAWAGEMAASGIRKIVKSRSKAVRSAGWPAADHVEHGHRLRGDAAHHRADDRRHGVLVLTLIVIPAIYAVVKGISVRRNHVVSAQHVPEVIQ